MKRLDTGAHVQGLRRRGWLTIILIVACTGTIAIGWRIRLAAAAPATGPSWGGQLINGTPHKS